MCRPGEDKLLKFKLSVRMEGRGRISVTLNVRILVGGARRAAGSEFFTTCCRSTGICTALQPSPGLTENYELLEATERQHQLVASKRFAE